MCILYMLYILYILDILDILCIVYTLYVVYVLMMLTWRVRPAFFVNGSGSHIDWHRPRRAVGCHVGEWISGVSWVVRQFQKTIRGEVKIRGHLHGGFGWVEKSIVL